MNTYSENLWATIVSSLQSQELELKSFESQKSAALFTVYYAQGAVITTTQKLQAAGKHAALKTKVKKRAVDSNNLANNQLVSATRADQYMKQSVTNMAVCASNVQIAANSITRLAGDIGTIFSILEAADQHSALYKSAAHVRELINDTAYNAEAASNLAMEASMHTAEIASTALLDQAKSTNGLMNNLLEICAAEFDTALQAATAATSELDAASVSNSLAGGNLQNIAVELDAAQLAYGTTNERLNFDLNVSDTGENSFTVSFDPVASPFEPNTSLPVAQDYYIILVKDSKKATFSLTTATAILEQGESGKHIVKIVTVAPQGTCSQRVKFGELALKDSDGDEIGYGQSYVVFLLAVYTSAYKKMLNDFSDYLSAASNTFVLTATGPKADITAKPMPVDTKGDKAQIGLTYTIRFCSPKPPIGDDLPEYRCILLPAASGLSKPDFVFDLAIAQQVQAANYTVGVRTETKAGFDYYTAAIGNETTDNFGNPLIGQAEYFVLVLTIWPGSAENTARFTDRLSDLNVHSKFQYLVKDQS